MRKAINITALLFFIWLLLDTLSLPDKFMYFLVIGELPGTTTTVPPMIMLAAMSGLIGFIICETIARHFDVARKIKHYTSGFASRRKRLPSRRFSRI